MAGFLAAETLCQTELSESVVGRAVRDAEQKQQQQAPLRTNHPPSQGRCFTAVVVPPC